MLEYIDRPTLYNSYIKWKPSRIVVVYGVNERECRDQQSALANL